MRLKYWQKLLYAFPILASLVVLWALGRYPLHGARLAAVRQQRGRLHAAQAGGAD